MRRCAVLGRHSSCSLPQPVRRAVPQTCLIALLTKPVSEPSLSKRAPIVSHQKRQVAELTRVDHPLKFWQHRKLECDRFAQPILLLREAQLPAMNVLPPEAHHI